MLINLILNVSGSYLYVEATYGSSGDITRLYSPTFSMTSTRCLEFHYHMWGDHIGELNIYLDVSFNQFYLILLFFLKLAFQDTIYHRQIKLLSYKELVSLTQVIYTCTIN